MKAGGSFLVAIAALAGSPSLFAVAQDESASKPFFTRVHSEGRLPHLDGATGWLNSPPLSAANLRGKVVLIDFWTYSCINWRRAEPYVRAWAEKYKDQGLIVIGVHSPEFDFEKDAGNVSWAVKDMHIEYPVAVDSNHAIWRAFRNGYWPALYFIDAAGNIRHHQFGEGAYGESEKFIQQLLAEAGGGAAGRGLVSVKADGLEAAPDLGNLRSPENYLGYERTENFVSRDGTIEDKHHGYVAPSGLRVNHWALVGDWTVGRQSIVLNKPDGRIVYQFHARDLHLVMGPAKSGATIRFRVLIDGQPPRGSHGLDVDDQGIGTISEQRLYQLVRQTSPVGEHQFQIEFLDSGAEAFSVTFG
jgi:thiol-disulfide isomerase/thioredoxin